jgi:ABC-type antimicrobial peptide transport system permease subunit
VSLVVTFAIFGGVFNPNYPLGPAGDPNSILFTINGTIANDFADFEPYSEEFDVNALQYTISPGLSNIANLGQFPTLSETQRLFIENNGFVTTPQSKFKQIHEILKDNDNKDIPSHMTNTPFYLKENGKMLLFVMLCSSQWL